MARRTWWTRFVDAMFPVTLALGAVGFVAWTGVEYNAAVALVCATVFVWGASVWWRLGRRR